MKKWPDMKPSLCFRFMLYRPDDPELHGATGVRFVSDTVSKLGKLYEFVADLRDGDPPDEFDEADYVGEWYRDRRSAKSRSRTSSSSRPRRRCDEPGDVADGWTEAEAIEKTRKKAAKRLKKAEDRRADRRRRSRGRSGRGRQRRRRDESAVLKRPKEKPAGPPPGGSRRLSISIQALYTCRNTIRRNYLDQPDPRRAPDLRSVVQLATGRTRQEDAARRCVVYRSLDLALLRRGSRSVALRPMATEIKGLWFATGPVEPGDELAIGGFDFDHCVANRRRDHRPASRGDRPRARELCRIFADRRDSDPRLVSEPRRDRSNARRTVSSSTARKRWLSITGNANLGTPRELVVFTDARASPDLRALDRTRRAKKERPAKPKTEVDRRRETARPAPAGGSRTLESRSSKWRRSRSSASSSSTTSEPTIAARGSTYYVLAQWIDEQTGTESREDVAQILKTVSREVRSRRRSKASGIFTRHRQATSDSRSDRFFAGRARTRERRSPRSSASEKASRSRRKAGRKLVTVDAGDVEIEPVRWLWHSRIPRSEAKLDRR